LLDQGNGCCTGLYCGVGRVDAGGDKVLEGQASTAEGLRQLFHRLGHFVVRWSLHVTASSRLGGVVLD
jgi:hypothetical protein